MKNTAIILSLFSSTAAAQSPYLSVTASMDAEHLAGRRFKIEMKICQPLKMTVREDWFTHDTSTIDFAALLANELQCREYAANGDGVEVLSGDITFEKYNQYEFSNQVFAWEKILVFRITDETAGDTLTPPRMYLVLPVKYKSFVTTINIDSIPFVEGHVLDLERSLGAYKDGRLSMWLKPERSAAIPFNSFAGKDWIE